VLRSPLQVKIAEAHTTVNRSSYPVAEDTLVLSQEYLRTNTTDESFAAAAGGDPRRVKRTIEKASTAIRRAKTDYEKRSVKKQDRLWREMRKRNRPIERQRPPNGVGDRELES
jgi:hypothetical protein